MNTSPTVIVSGLARCGTSLTMQMLQACGLKCAGDFPAFEPQEINILNGPLRREWVEQFDAIKIIDPHRGEIPPVNGLVIWLDRNPIQQAVSQIKLLTAISGFSVQLGTVGRFAQSLISERDQARKKYSAMPMIDLSFEMAVERPREFCEAVATFLIPCFALNVEKMLSCLEKRTRGAKCELDLEIENRLIRVAELRESVA